MEATMARVIANGSMKTTLNVTLAVASWNFPTGIRDLGLEAIASRQTARTKKQMSSIIGSAPYLANEEPQTANPAVCATGSE
jgi:hypothetical protein